MSAFGELTTSFVWGAHHVVDDTASRSSSLFSRLDPNTLSTVPSTLLLGSLPLVWFLSSSTPDIIRAGRLLQFKIAFGYLIIGTEAGFLSSRILNAATFMDGPVLAAVLSVLAACSLPYLLTLDHHRNLSSLALLTAWLVVAAICDALRAAVFYHDKTLNLFSMSAIILPVASSTVFKVSLITLSEFAKHDLIIDARLSDSVSKIRTSGILTRLLLSPLYEKLLSRFDRDIATTDLAALETEFSSHQLLQTFNRHWTTRNMRSSNALARVCGAIILPDILSSVPLRLVCCFFTVIQPILIKYLVQYALGTYLFNSGTRVAMVLIGATAWVYGGAMVSRGVYGHAMARMATLLRGTLIAAVYQKTLALATAGAQQHTAMTVISKRVDSTVREISFIHNVWASPLELIFCIYILFTLLGNAAFLSILPIAASHCIGWYARDKVPTDRVNWHGKIKDRVAEVSGLLAEAKAISSIGLDTTFLRRIRKRYSIEIAHFKKFRRWAVVLETSVRFFDLTLYPMLLGGALTLAVWTERLSVADAFTVLATIAVMSEPLNSCAMVSSEFKSVVTRLNQIEEYLLAEEIHGQRSQHAIDHDSDTTSSNKVDDTTARPGKMQGRTVESLKPMFELINAAVSIQTVPYPILERVTAKIMRGDTTMIVGRTGSGKSSLLRSVIGETKITAGFRYRAPAHSIAYCGQTTWLWDNKSIRQNIIAYSALDAEWYTHVLEVCQLMPDLRQLPKRDKTIIKLDGMNLSKSQRDRVALARAIYSRSSMLVLDDIFSSLDDNTISKIGSRLFGPAGLLQRSTVVLVTHSRLLLPFATRTWLFDVDGRLVERSGSADALFQRKFQTILADIASDENEQRVHGGEQAATHASYLQSTPSDAIASCNQKMDARRRGSWKVLLFYLQTFECPMVLLWLGLVILTSVGAKFPVAYICLWLGNQSDSSNWLSTYLLFAVSSAFFTGWTVYLWWMQLVPKSIEYIHEHMLQTITDATFHYLSTIDLRSVLTIFTQDMFSVSDILPNQFFEVVYDIWNVCIQGVIIIYISGVQGIFITPGIMTVLAIIQSCYMGRSRQLTYLELDSQANFQAYLTDTENGLEHIRAFGWETENLQFAMRLLDDSQKPFYYNHGARNWLRIALDTVIMCVGVFLAIWTSFHLQASPVFRVGISLTILISLRSNLVSLSFDWATLQASLGALERIKTLTESTPHQHSLPIGVGHVAGPEWPENGKVVMRNVSAKYEGSENSPTVLKDISLMLPPGRHIGVVGDSGSGKSSFTRAILNFLEHSGDIIIDGVNIAEVPHNLLRSRITTISQDGINFDESVRYNLCPWTMSVSETEGNVHDDSIILMLKTLKLWHLVEMRGGLDTPFKELGLSPGQRKLICIARACLHKLSTRTRLVIMDGPLDGLADGDRELALIAMDAAFFDCTIIEVAETAEDIPKAHVILHMENGRVVKRELPNQGVPDSPPPSPPPTMPTAPVPMNPRFQRMLDKSLAAEREVRQQLQDQGLWPPELGE